MYQNMREILSLGLEAAVNGNLHKEIEFTFYGRLKDITQLERAVRTEEHEQWRLPMGVDIPGFRTRLREIDGRRWVLCGKRNNENGVGWLEVENDLTKDMFQFLKLGATDGYRKTRYEFPVAGTDRIWEVDVFLTPDGKKSLWVKIDLEVEDPNAPIPSFPLDFDEIITNQEVQQTQTEQAFIEQLWKSEWARLDG